MKIQKMLFPKGSSQSTGLLWRESFPKGMPYGMNLWGGVPWTFGVSVTLRTLRFILCASKIREGYTGACFEMLSCRDREFAFRRNSSEDDLRCQFLSDFIVFISA